MECEGHLQAAGLLADSAGEVVHLLEQWEGAEEEWSNGVVVELGRKFKCPEVMNAATMLVACLVGMNLQCLNCLDKNVDPKTWLLILTISFEVKIRPKKLTACCNMIFKVKNLTQKVGC